MKALAISVSLVITSTVQAQTDFKNLKIGDDAPTLYIQEWIKGDPVNSFEQGKIYVVEFSATWCPPCRKAVPHLTRLAQKFRGKADIVSIYVEGNTKLDSTKGYVKKVRAFADAMGDKMQYTVAVDVPAEKTSETIGVTGVPSVFIIDHLGSVAWTGSIMGVDTVLDQIVQRTYDVNHALKEKQRFRKWLDTLMELKSHGHYQIAVQQLDSAMERHPENVIFPYLKFRALAGDNDKGAYEWLKMLLTKDPEGFDWPHFVDSEFFNITPQHRNYALELKAIDKTIVTSETESLKVFPLTLKARTLWKLRNKSAALQTLQEAIDIGVTNDLSSWGKSYRRVMYFLLDLADPGDTLALLYTNKTLRNKSLNNTDRLLLLRTKIKVFERGGDISKAIAAAEEALALSKSNGNTAEIISDEKKLLELKKMSIGQELIKE